MATMATILFEGAMVPGDNIKGDTDEISRMAPLHLQK
jgi:hypothetical protein